MILMAGLTTNEQEAQKMILSSISSGKAMIKFRELVMKQGGDITYIEQPQKFEKAKYIIPVTADYRGALKVIDTEMIGNISVYIHTNDERKVDGAVRNLKNAFILDPKRVAKQKTILGIVK